MVKKYKVGDFVDLVFLRNSKQLNSYIETVKGKDYIYEVMRYKDKIYFVHTTGKCDTKKCKAACCKLVPMKSYKSEPFQRNFADITIKRKGQEYNMYRKRCKHLTRSNKCAIHGKKSQPFCCDIFPNTADLIYEQLFDVCTKKIRIDKIEDMSKK